LTPKLRVAEPIENAVAKRMGKKSRVMYFLFKKWKTEAGIFEYHMINVVEKRLC
jgi:hypothetical protein